MPLDVCPLTQPFLWDAPSLAYAWFAAIELNDFVFQFIGICPAVAVEAELPSSHIHIKHFYYKEKGRRILSMLIYLPVRLLGKCLMLGCHWIKAFVLFSFFVFIFFVWLRVSFQRNLLTKTRFMRFLFLYSLRSHKTHFQMHQIVSARIYLIKMLLLTLIKVNVTRSDTKSIKNTLCNQIIENVQVYEKLYKIYEICWRFFEMLLLEVLRFSCCLLKKKLLLKCLLID